MLVNTLSLALVDMSVSTGAFNGVRKGQERISALFLLGMTLEKEGCEIKRADKC